MQQENQNPDYFLLDKKDSKINEEIQTPHLGPINLNLEKIATSSPQSVFNNFIEEKEKGERPKVRNKTLLPKTNSFSGPMANSNSMRVVPKHQTIFMKTKKDFARAKEESDLKKILLENARKKYIRELWINNFLVIALFIKKFIETLKSINIVSKFLKLTEYHYNIINDKVYFYNGFNESVEHQWMMQTTKKFVKQLKGGGF